MFKGISSLIPALGLTLLSGHTPTTDNPAEVSAYMIRDLHRSPVNTTVHSRFQHCVDQLSKAIDDHDIEELKRQVQNLKTLQEQNPQPEFFVKCRLRDNFIKVYENFYKENIRLIQTGTIDHFNQFLDKLLELRSIDRDLFESPARLLKVEGLSVSYDEINLFSSSQINAKAVLAKILPNSP